MKTRLAHLGNLLDAKVSLIHHTLSRDHKSSNPKP